MIPEECRSWDMAAWMVWPSSKSSKEKTTRALWGPANLITDTFDLFSPMTSLETMSEASWKMEVMKMKLAMVMIEEMKSR